MEHNLCPAQEFSKQMQQRTRKSAEITPQAGWLAGWCVKPQKLYFFCSQEVIIQTGKLLTLAKPTQSRDMKSFLKLFEDVAGIIVEVL